MLADDTVRDAEEIICNKREMILEREIHQAEERLPDWVIKIFLHTLTALERLVIYQRKHLGTNMNGLMKGCAQYISPAQARMNIKAEIRVLNMQQKPTLKR